MTLNQPIIPFPSVFFFLYLPSHDHPLYMYSLFRRIICLDQRTTTPTVLMIVVKLPMMYKSTHLPFKLSHFSSLSNIFYTSFLPSVFPYFVLTAIPLTTGSLAVSSTRSPFLNLLSRLAQSGRWSSFGKRVWFTESHIFLIISFYLFYLFHLLLI